MKGLGSFALSAMVYSNLTYLSFLFGPTAPMIAITAGFVYGAQTFMHAPKIVSIEFEKGGAHDGWLKLGVSQGPLAVSMIIVHPKEIRSITEQGADDTYNVDDVPDKLVFIGEFYDCQSKET